MIEYNKENIMKWSRLGSRKALGSVLGDLAETHSDLFLLTADVANSLGVEEFAAQYPNQFLNAGIAEMNMIGMASGMSLENFHPIAASFAPFITMRCFEAVRTYIGYMTLPVILIGMAGGLSMGVGGNTHFSLEDLALMRLIPNMTVISPADCTETIKAIQAAVDYPHPVYIRLTGQPGQPPVYKEDYTYTIGKGIIHGDGRDVVILATGTMVYESIRALRLLTKEGIQACVVDMHTLKPFDEELLKSLSSGKLFVTVEEHFLNGGLGSIAAEILVDNNIKVPLLRIGLSDEFAVAASYNYLLQYYGLNAKDIAHAVTDKLKVV